MPRRPRSCRATAHRHSGGGGSACAIRYFGGLRWTEIPPGAGKSRPSRLCQPSAECDFKVATGDTEGGHVLCSSETGAACARALRSEGSRTMNHKRRPDRVAAIVAVLSMLMQPTANVITAASQVSPRRSQRRRPPRRRPLRRRSRSQSRRPRRLQRRRLSMAAGRACKAWRAKAASSSISRRSRAGRTEQPSWPSAPSPIAARPGQARARHDQDRGEHQSCHHGAAGQFSSR